MSSGSHARELNIGLRHHSLTTIQEYHISVVNVRAKKGPSYPLGWCPPFIWVACSSERWGLLYMSLQEHHCKVSIRNNELVLSSPYHCRSYVWMKHKVAEQKENEDSVPSNLWTESYKSCFSLPHSLFLLLSVFHWYLLFLPPKSYHLHNLIGDSDCGKEEKTASWSKVLYRYAGLPAHQTPPPT